MAAVEETIDASLPEVASLDYGPQKLPPSARKYGKWGQTNPEKMIVLVQSANAAKGKEEVGGLPEHTHTHTLCLSQM